MLYPYYFVLYGGLACKLPNAPKTGCLLTLCSRHLRHGTHGFGTQDLVWKELECGVYRRM